jgi:Domain of unknown function (DUF4189)
MFKLVKFAGLAVLVLGMVVTPFEAYAQKGGSRGGSGAGKGADNWGAIAYEDADGHWGLSYNYATRAEAERIALSECGTRGCKIAIWFKNSCGAVAQSATYWGVGEGNSRREAEKEALSSCGQRSCEIVAWACTDR